MTRGSQCEYCKLRPWTDLHHALVRRDKRFQREIDQEVNFMAVCHTCHMNGYVDPNEVSTLFFFMQQVRGYDPVLYIINLPLKIKPKYFQFSCDIDTLAIKIDRPIWELLKLNLVS